MNSILEELKIALNNIAISHGVVIEKLNVSYVDISNIHRRCYVVDKIEIDQAKLVEPKC